VVATPLPTGATKQQQQKQLQGDLYLCRSAYLQHPQQQQQLFHYLSSSSDNSENNNHSKTVVTTSRCIPPASGLESPTALSPILF
jgi:hypothetical protein